jgi:hypothetical protein
LLRLLLLLLLLLPESIHLVEIVRMVEGVRAFSVIGLIRIVGCDIGLIRLWWWQGCKDNMRVWGIALVRARTSSDGVCHRRVNLGLDRKREVYTDK